MTSKSASKVFGECRCCQQEGYHKELTTGIVRNGSRETYLDMFLECFNLFLSTNSKLSNLICSSCIKKLKEAYEFKTIVVETEKQLLTCIEDMLFVNVPQAADIKEPEDTKTKVKEEPDDEDSTSYHDMYIDLPPNDEFEPIEKKPKIGEEKSQEENEAALIARFAPTLRPLPLAIDLYGLYPSFAKALDLFRGKKIFASMIEKKLKRTEQKLQAMLLQKSMIPEKFAQIENTTMILANSNVTPFKSKNRAGFPCFYCREVFDNIATIREHQAKAHRKRDIRKLVGTHGVESLIVYVDITDLKCTICEAKLPNLNELKSHLIKQHKKTYYPEFTDRIVPYKLSENNGLECQLCGFTFETFGSIERHMNVHFRNYVCKDCGTGFVTRYRLKVHTKNKHVEGNYQCESCKKIFPSQQKLKNHIDTVHNSVKRFKCSKCPERFNEYFRRQKHLVTEHGVAPLQYKCNVCEKSFDRRYTLSRHLKRDHLEERDFQCEVCAYKCFTRNELRVHMIKHTGERIFECSICKKSYARKKTLREHLRIHSNDRRFACAVCGQAFVQKCSLKGHMKTHHVEYSVNL